MVAIRHELELLPMLEYAADQLRGHAEQKQITLATNLSAKLPTVIGDRDKLQAALLNLVGNAIKYTPENGQVSVVLERHDNALVGSVKDTGIGISEEVLEHIFEPFFTARSGGTGLGLYISRELLELNRATLLYLDRPGGAMFTRPAVDLVARKHFDHHFKQFGLL